MQCPECQSAHIRKNGKKKANRTISASSVVVSLSTSTMKWATQTSLSENA